MPKENCQSSRHAEFLYFIAYFPLTLLPLLSLSLALLFLIFLVYCKQNKTQSKHTFSTHRQREGEVREGGREAEPTHLYVNMKSSKHTHLACSNTHSYKHTHAPTLTHTHAHTRTPTHTHSCRRTHVGYLMLFSIQATLFAAAFALSRVFIFSHPLKQALQSTCTQRVLYANYTHVYIVQCAC